MTTKTAMITEMESILKRTDLTTEVGQAIDHAIDIFRNEKLWFMETKSKSFATVASQVYYTSSDDADIGLTSDIYSAQIRISNTDYPLCKITDISEFEILQDGNTSTGQPTHWVWFESSIGIYPKPDDAYTITIIGNYVPAAPATDGEASNPWMVSAYDLVMFKALEFIYASHTDEIDRSRIFNQASQAQLDIHYTKTNRRKAGNRLIPTRF